MQVPRFLIFLNSLLLFSVVGFLLFIKLNSYPATLYNWENYTVWNIFQLKFNEPNVSLKTYAQTSDGLMTESGFSPIIGLPLYWITTFFSYTLANLRVWTALLTLIGALIFYLFISHLFGKKIGTLATVLLCSSQAFLLYGRTATNVGPTLLAEMLTIVVIYYCLRHPSSLRLATCAFVAICMNYYFYAPIRFFTPMLFFCIIRFLTVYFLGFIQKQSTKQKHRKIDPHIITWTVIAISVTSIFVARTNILKYYNGREEQLLTSIFKQPLSTNLLHELILKTYINSQDFIQLLFSFNSRPVVIDFGNHFGQMINRSLVPFFILGLIYSFYKLRNESSNKFTLILSWFLISSLPILFTSNVHIGRLFLSLAPMYVLVAIGITELANHFLHIKWSRVKKNKKKANILLFSTILVFCVYVSSSEIHAYFFTTPTLDHNIKVLQENQARLTSKKIYLLNAENTSLHFWEIAYYLKNQVFFTDSKTTKSLDRLRSSKQISDGILFSNNSDYQSLTTTCLHSDSVLIIIGKKPDFFASTNPPVCRVTTIRLFQ